MLRMAPASAVSPARCVVLARPVSSTWASGLPLSASITGWSAVLAAPSRVEPPSGKLIADVALPQSSFCSGRMSLESSAALPLPSPAALAAQLPLAASWWALERRHRGVEPGGGEELERGQHPAVDLPGL